MIDIGSGDQTRAHASGCCGLQDKVLACSLKAGVVFAHVFKGSLVTVVSTDLIGQRDGQSAAETIRLHRLASQQSVGFGFGVALELDLGWYLLPYHRPPVQPASWPYHSKGHRSCHCCRHSLCNYSCLLGVRDHRQRITGLS